MKRVVDFLKKTSIIIIKNKNSPRTWRTRIIEIRYRHTMQIKSRSGNLLYFNPLSIFPQLYWTAKIEAKTKKIETCSSRKLWKNRKSTIETLIRVLEITLSMCVDSEEERRVVRLRGEKGAVYIGKEVIFTTNPKKNIGYNKTQLWSCPTPS